MRLAPWQKTIKGTFGQAPTGKASTSFRVKHSNWSSTLTLKMVYEATASTIYTAIGTTIFGLPPTKALPCNIHSSPSAPSKLSYLRNHMLGCSYRLSPKINTATSGVPRKPDYYVTVHKKTAFSVMIKILEYRWAVLKMGA